MKKRILVFLLLAIAVVSVAGLQPAAQAETLVYQSTDMSAILSAMVRTQGAESDKYWDSAAAEEKTMQDAGFQLLYGKLGAEVEVFTNFNGTGLNTADDQCWDAGDGGQQL